MGLAEKMHGTTWQLDPDFKRQLMDLGAHHDIIKQLYGSLGNKSMYVSQGADYPGGVRGSGRIGPGR